MYVPIYRTQLVREASVNYHFQKCGPLNSTHSTIRNVPTLVSKILENSPNEKMVTITVDAQLKPIGIHIVTEGLLDSAMLHSREIFRTAILDNASSIFLVHNHPSGELNPSPEDNNMFKRVREQGDILGIQVIDSLIVGVDNSNLEFRAISMRELL